MALRGFGNFITVESAISDNAAILLKVERKKIHQSFVTDIGALLDTAVDKVLFQPEKILIFFLFLPKNINCGTH